ncbi:hypothetical protein M9Y10_044983 [Tritrichomonas musculus]|uniref:Uncharacterized protein n=1 Tax=Tritrichomonas musculus TaxID=1915356 RepID=A0ABR2JU02_9EUKA
MQALRINRFNKRVLVLLILLFIIVTVFTFQILNYSILISSFDNKNPIQTIPRTDTTKHSTKKLGLRCPVCNFTPVNPPTSTRRDVVLAAALTQLKRVEYFLRTLRTTGTKARIILFLDNEKTATIEWRKFFTACDIEPVFISNPDPVVQSAPKLSRYYYYQEWLSKHIDEVDRVLHTDTFDVIFQSDPFIPIITTDSLYFTFEPVTLKSSFWTEQWITQCYGKSITKKYGNRAVSCSGVTAGGAQPFLKYLNILLSTPKWVTCFGHSLDQAHHNYLLYNGDFEKAGLNISSFDCNSPYLTMHFCCKRAKCSWMGEGYVYGNNSNLAPVLVHQYNRWKNLTKRNPIFCPANDDNVLSMTEDEEPTNLSSLSPLTTTLPNITFWPP